MQMPKWVSFQVSSKQMAAARVKYGQCNVYDN